MTPMFALAFSPTDQSIVKLHALAPETLVGYHATCGNPAAGAIRQVQFGRCNRFDPAADAI